MIDYDKEIRNRLSKNLNWLRNNIDDKSVIYKIHKYCEKWNDDFDSVINEIINNDRFARFFIKDPKKQNIYEEVFIEYVTKNGYNIIKLPSVGKNAICIENGSVRNGSSNIHSTKSMDYKSVDNGIITYYYHKYINESGGAQDNQYNDIIHFIKEASKVSDDINFVVLADGKYFTDSKMDEMRSLCNYNTEIKTSNDF